MFSRAAFHRQQTTAMHIFEIAVRKLVSALRIHSLTFVRTQMPLRVFGKVVRTDKLVFHVGRRFVLAPCAFAISDQMSFLDKLRRKRDRILVDPDTVTRLRPGVTDRVETNDQPDSRYTIELAEGNFHSCKSKRLPHARKWQHYSPHRAAVQSATGRIRRGELGRTLEWGAYPADSLTSSQLALICSTLGKSMIWRDLT